MTDPAQATFSIDHQRVISEVLDDEAVIIDSHTGAYFSLDPAGTAVWATLGSDGPLTATAVAEATSVDLRVVTSVLGELCAAGLVATSGGAPPVDSTRSPSLTEYRDMEALLLLDPIHDVDDAGWPIARAGD